MHYNIITCTTHHQCPEKKIKKILLTVRFEPALAKDLRKKKKKKVATVGFEPAPASFFCPNQAKKNLGWEKKKKPVATAGFEPAPGNSNFNLI